MNNFSMDDYSDLVIKASEEQIAKALEMCGLVAEGYAKLECPVDSGFLRNSITYKVIPEELAVYVGTNVEYGTYVEFGTGIYYDEGGRQTPWVYQAQDGSFHMTDGMRARPYIRLAISDHLEEYRRIIEQELKGE